MEWQAVGALVLGIAITLFVPALVWATVIAGSYQIVRDKIREKCSPSEFHPLSARAQR
jgi:hypothetical protein